MPDVDLSKPSRELDALVATKVFGWELITRRRFAHSLPDHDMGTVTEWIGSNPDGMPAFFVGQREGKYIIGDDKLPHFSTDIADAWRVVHHLRDLWTKATNGVSGLDDSFARPFHDCDFFESLHRSADRRWPWAFLYVTPLAICLAALKVVEKGTHSR